LGGRLVVSDLIYGRIGRAKHLKAIPKNFHPSAQPPKSHG
jgi:hypothetical protein